MAIPDDLEEACALMCTERGAVRPLDVGRLGGPREEQIFLLRASVGFEAEAVRGAKRDLKDRFGPLAYGIGAVKALGNPTLSRYRLTLDGHTTETEGVLCAINNAGNVGRSDLLLAPGISVSDGLLDIVVWHSADTGSLVSLVASIVAGNERAEALQHWRARAVRLEAEPAQPIQVDGEMCGETPIEAGIIPGAVRVIAPAGTR